jgi:hypothetical protein
MFAGMYTKAVLTVIAIAPSIIAAGRAGVFAFAFHDTPQ